MAYEFRSVPSIMTLNNKDAYKINKTIRHNFVR